ncbi:hypothetical protein FB472_1958 [Rhodoglobus vestalii]|uniref:Scaffolding protein n=1 Tax=Rhodoglobus vestalii TaxID=193384 RepID=A0A8H2K913_9MICO|nr:hypothetical protein [Rhodoglobus vestalii]TQO20327.1 hypothetical protein FB472_1958 [Rhodoglobus vestalii]
MTDTTQNTDTAGQAETEPTPTDSPTPDSPVEDNNTETNDTENTGGAVTKARKEAAKYRERLRTVESERDTGNATVESLRRQIIDGHITSDGMKPSAVWATGHTVADLLNDDGTVNTEAVNDAIKETRETLGISRFAGTGDQGPRQAAPAQDKPKWSDLLSQ